MKDQATIFLESEGDKWFSRNKDNLGKHDHVTEAMQRMKLEPKCVLEIGCGNGWRLAKLRNLFGCEVSGVDPSMAAIKDAWDAQIPKVFTGVAHHLPFFGHVFDVVIFGFCLYLSDPKDLFRVAMEADRVLRDGGHLIIHDFEQAPDPEMAFARYYKHAEGVLSYHMDFAQVWLAHPWYRMAYRTRIDDEMVTILTKNTKSAFPVTR